MVREATAPRELGAHVLDENQRKNRAVAAVVAAAPGLEPTEVGFKVTADGAVELTLPARVAAHREAAASALAQAPDLRGTVR